MSENTVPRNVKWTWTDREFGRQFWYYDPLKQEWIKDKFVKWEEIKAQRRVDFLNFSATL